MFGSAVPSCIILSLLISFASATPQCESYAGTLCSSVITYQVYIDEIPQVVLEDQLMASGIQNLTLIGGAVDPLCAQAALQYACATAFPGCGNGTGKKKRMWKGRKMCVRSSSFTFVVLCVSCSPPTVVSGGVSEILFRVHRIANCTGPG